MSVSLFRLKQCYVFMYYALVHRVCGPRTSKRIFFVRYSTSIIYVIKVFAQGSSLRSLLPLTKLIYFTWTARRDLPLGIEDYKIKDRSLSASSEWNTYHGARFGRLNAVARGRNKGAWSARRNNRRQWIMVSFFLNAFSRNYLP